MEKTLQELCRQYRRYRMCVLAFLPLLGAAAICAFFNRTLTLLLLGTAVAYQLFYLRRRQKQYLRELIRANLESTVCQKLGAEPPEERGGGDGHPARGARRTTDAVRRNRGLLPVGAGDHRDARRDAGVGLRRHLRADIPFGEKRPQTGALHLRRMGPASASRRYRRGLAAARPRRDPHPDPAGFLCRPVIP